MLVCMYIYIYTHIHNSLLLLIKAFLESLSLADT